MARLNVGCGDYPLLYWINLDSDPTKRADIHADALEHLQGCPEGLYDEIYAGHFLEHLEPEAAAAFLRECYRVVIPGGRVGVVVPDTRIIMQRWLAEARDMIEYPEGTWNSIADLDSICELFLYATAQDSHHHWSYDERTLARIMHEAGFERLTEIDRYRDPRIPVGAWYQCGLNGYKETP